MVKECYKCYGLSSILFFGTILILQLAMMKLSIRYPVAALLAWSFLSSCSSMYLPNVPATPMFNNQGEVYLAAHINPKGHLSGSAAVALTDHVAVLASGSYIDHGFKSNKYMKQWLTEGAIGYFTKVGQQNRRTIELYTGYGIGYSMQDDKRATTKGFEAVETRQMDFNKLFLQVNYSSTRDRKVNLLNKERELSYGTTIRASRIAMDQFLLNGEEAANEEVFLIEPVFYTRLQLNKGLHLQYSSGFNIGLNNKDYLKAGNSILTLGVVYSLGKK